MSRAEALVPPVVIFVALCVLVLVAGFRDRLPLDTPSCQFREATGLPCVSCGGTRAFEALAKGKVGKALALNPLAALSVFGVFTWLVMTATLPRKKEPGPPATPQQRRRRLYWGLGITAAAMLLNWIYLLFYLP